MLPPLYTLLSTTSAVSAIVSTRIYPHGEAPQDATQPYVTWQMISGVPENSLSESPDIDRCTLQVNCWHQTSSGIVALATAVRTALETIGHVTGVPINQRDTETRLYWIAIQVDWLYNR